MRIRRADVTEAHRRLGLGLMLGLVGIGTFAPMIMMPRRAAGVLLRPTTAPDSIRSPRAAPVSVSREADPLSRSDRPMQLRAAGADAARPANLTRPALTSRTRVSRAALSPLAHPVRATADPEPSAAMRAPHTRESAAAVPDNQHPAEPPSRDHRGALVIGATHAPGGAGSPAPGRQFPDTGSYNDGGPAAGTDSGDADSVLQLDGTLDPESVGAQMIVVGPATARLRETVTFSIAVENVLELSHAPLQLVYNADVLEFVSAQEGAFLSSGGAATQFLAAESSTPGLMDFAVSRMPSAGGVKGSGTLCSATFLAKAAGASPILTLGSRLLDQRGRPVSFRRNDSYVTVN